MAEYYYYGDTGGRNLTFPGVPDPSGNIRFPGTNPTYDPFGGGGSAFGGGGGGGAGAGGQNWLGWFLPLLSNLGTGYLQGKAQSKSDKANREAIQDRIRAALAALSPENISALAKAFLPQIMATLNPQAQTAIQGLATSQARRGLYQSPIGAASEAGLRGQLAQAGPQQAFAQAMGLAGQQAGALTGLPIPQVQPNYGAANAFGGAFNSALAGYALTQRREPEPPSPYASAFDFPKYGVLGR
jgi:hypothetical protein